MTAGADLQKGRDREANIFSFSYSAFRASMRKGPIIRGRREFEEDRSCGNCIERGPRQLPPER